MVSVPPPVMVKLTVAGKVTVENELPDSPFNWRLATPQALAAEHVPPPTRMAPPVTVRPVKEGVAEVGKVAGMLAGMVKTTVPLVAPAATDPKRKGTTSDTVIGVKTLALTGTTTDSAEAVFAKPKAPAATNMATGIKRSDARELLLFMTTSPLLFSVLGTLR
ncbi:MAG: hypothetical protein RLZZ157_669 [Pseudomonadota bacterium]